MKTLLRATVLLTLAAIASASAWLAASQTVTSRWKDSDREIKTDGQIAEWTELIAFDEGVSIAAFNDDADVYLAIAVSEPQRRRQLLATGLIVWLDPKGGKAQKFGIQIAGSGFVRPDRGGGTSIPNPYEGEPAIVPRQEPAQPKLTHVELLGPGKDDRRRIELSGESGIRAGAQVEGDTLLYELKISLAQPSASQPYGVGAVPGRPLVDCTH